MLKTALALLVVTSFCAGCQTSREAALPSGQGWAVWCGSHHDPRGKRVDLEKLTDEQLAQADAVLELGKKRCGWR